MISHTDKLGILHPAYAAGVAAGRKAERDSMRCETCKFFDDTQNIYASGFGDCNAEKQTEFFQTNKKFGCIHHQLKEGV